jgi:hypothetical protein
VGQRNTAIGLAVHDEARGLGRISIDSNNERID